METLALVGTQGQEIEADRTSISYLRLEILQPPVRIGSKVRQDLLKQAFMP